MDWIDSAILNAFPAVQMLREKGGAYLASNTMGLIPTVALDAEIESVRAQQAMGIAVWDDGGPWLKTLDRYASVIGRMLDVPTSWVCPVTNITDALWRIFSAIDFKDDRRGLMTTAMAFTTQDYAGHGFAKYGAEVITVPSDDKHHRVPTERLVATIKKERPAILQLSHAAFESAYLHDLSAISAACKSVGTIFCLDVAQTGFVVPFSFEETGADIIVLQQHKWGCAGTGAACIVASEAFTRAHEPALVGWMSHAKTFEFPRGPAEFSSSAWRFCGGTPDVPSKARGAAAAELLVDKVGIPAIQRINRRLVAQMVDGLKDAGFDVIDQPQRTGFVAIQCSSEAVAKAYEAELKARHILIDGRGARLRVGPHFYNTYEDIDRFLEVMFDLKPSF